MKGQYVAGWYIAVFILFNSSVVIGVKGVISP